MRLVDFGCGPGTLSLGLAAIVTPGEVLGIDIFRGLDRPGESAI
jgi:ubiquinone/menaquinone biosynthesis C-methylase UbiE